MNCDNCEEPKNSRTAAATGLALIRSCGITVSISTARHAFLDGAFHAQQADAELVFHQLAHRTHAAIAEIVDVVDFAAAVTQFGQRLEDRQNVFLAQHPHGVGRIQAHAHVHLHPADRGQVIAFRIEEKLAEQGLGGIQRGRLARAHDAIDVDQRLFAGMVLVHRQRVADIGAGGDAIDIDDFDFVEAGFARVARLSVVSSSPAST